MGGCRAWWAAMIVALAASDGSGADGPPSAFVGEVLGRRIIGPDLGSTEVRMFAEEKVSRMPEVRDLAD